MLYVHEVASVNLFHIKFKETHDFINNERKDKYDKTENNREKHLILFSLFNTLLPDVELKRSLFATVVVSKGDDVLNEPIVNALEIRCLHQEEALECLTQVKCT